MSVVSSFNFEGFDTFIVEVEDETGAAKDGEATQ